MAGDTAQPSPQTALSTLSAGPNMVNWVTARMSEFLPSSLLLL